MTTIQLALKCLTYTVLICVSVAVVAVFPLLNGIFLTNRINAALV
jgi:hypothetical protein